VVLQGEEMAVDRLTCDQPACIVDSWFTR
jgi:hypothetical protein